MKFSMLPGLLKLMLIFFVLFCFVFVCFFLLFFCRCVIQGIELCWYDFMKYTFYIVMCQDSCEPICFKVGMMLNTIKLYSFIPL